MNFPQLQQSLAPQAGKVSITQDTLSENFRDFLKTCYANQPIVITGATQETEGEETLVVRGNSTFLNVPDLPVVARFWLDAQGNAQAQLSYSLRGEMPGPNDWRFTTSFPQLPSVINYNTPLPEVIDEDTDLIGPQIPYLDALTLSNTALVVCTQALESSSSGAPLAAGINFVSDLKPRGSVGILENLIGDTAPLLLYGTIRTPTLTEVTTPLTALDRPWDRPDAPGIHLLAALNANFSLGKMSVSETQLRVYSPPSTDWMADNDSFEPVYGYTGKLQIPSAGIEIELGAMLEWGMDEALLYAKCEGITLGKLTALLDLAGTDKLTDKLPKEIQKAVDLLDTLELTYLSLLVGIDGMTPFLSSVTFSLGFPNLVWKVWDDDLVVSDIGCMFEIDDPFGALSDDGPSLAVTVYGTIEVEGVPLQISARSADDFTLYARLAEQQTIPLEKLMKKYVPGVPAPGDLTIDGLIVAVSPGNFYAMSALLAGQPNPWEINVGFANLTISDVSLNFTYPSGGPLGGNFSGAIAFDDDVTLTMKYAIPGQFMIRGDFQKIKLSQVLKKLVNQPFNLPGGFDLTFIQSSVVISAQNENYVFQLATEVAGFGSIVVEVRKIGSSNAWGFALGLDLSAGNPSQLPGLSVLGAIEKAFTLEKFLLVIASYDNANIQFPDMAQFNNPRISAGNISMPAQTGGMMAGLYVFAQWTIDTGDSKQKLLKTFLGLNPTMSVALQLGENPAEEAKFYLSYSSSIQKHPFDFQLGAQLTQGNLSLFLTGTLTVEVQKQPLTFDVVMLFVTSGAFFSGTMTGTVKFAGIRLSDLALVIGVNWGGIPSLGLAATIGVGSFSSSIAIFFDSADPSKSLLAGSVSDLSLGDIVTSIAGSSVPDELSSVIDMIGVEGSSSFVISDQSIADALDNLQIEQVSAAFQKYGKISIPTSQEAVLLVVGKRGKSWHLTNLQDNMRQYELEAVSKGIRVSLEAQLYCVPQDSYVGALKFPEGFFINGTLNMLGLKSTSTVEINPDKGIAAESSLNQALVIFNQKFFSLSDLTGKTGPKFSVSTFRQPQLEKDFQDPHLYLTGRLTMSGLVLESYAKATLKGLEFLISEQRSLSMPDVSFSGKLDMGYTIQGAFDSITNFSAGGDINLSFNGQVDLGKLSFLGKAVSDLGKVSLKMAVAGSASMGYDGKTAFVQFSGTVEFQNNRRNFRLNLDASNADLTKAGNLAYQELIEVFKEVFNTAEKWINATKSGVVIVDKGANQMTKALKNGYGKTSKDAFKLVRSTGRDFKEMSSAFKDVYDSTPDDIGSYMKDLGANSDVIADTLKASYSASSEDVAKVLNNVGFSTNSIAGSMKNIYKQSAEDVADTLDAAGCSVNDITKALKGVYNLNASDAQTLLDDTFDLDQDDMEKLLKDAGYSSSDVKKVVDSAYKSAKKATKKAKKKAKKIF